MGFFNKTAEEKEEKILKDEQKADDKLVKQALKDVERANKAELKAAKEEHNTVEVSFECGNSQLTMFRTIRRLSGRSRGSLLS